MSGRLDGKLALVTGAGSGLGRATALHLAAEGARVAATDLDGGTATRTAGEIGEAAIAIAHDVTDEAAWAAAVAETVERLGGLNVLVNNAGISLHGDIETTTLADFEKLLDVDLTSVFLGCRAAVPAMRESGPASIVNVSSVAGLLGNPNTVGYGTAKAGVRYLTKSVALDCAQKGDDIRCNSIHPTYIRTPLMDPFIAKEGALKRIERMVPRGRICETGDVTPAIVFLASDESAMITGAELVIDGGVSAGYTPRVE